MDIYKKAKGRGSHSNEESRFHSQKQSLDLTDYGWLEEDDLPQIKTEFFKDSSKSILSKNNSPDLGFQYSINCYRGCEHGCSYCYARPTHEYLGLSAGLDFESKIFVKYEAAKLLEKQFMNPNWEPQVVFMSGVTDCYQPAERKFKLTRACLEVFLKFKNPTSIITKNHLICRDIDLLKELAQENLVSTCLSVTSLNPEVSRKLEPRTSVPQSRLKAIEELAKAGIPVSINIAPVIPGLTDHEIPAILKACADAGAQGAGFVPLRLPHSVKDLFANWLEQHFPERKNKVLGAIMDIRDGKLYDSNFGSRMRGEGPRADQMYSSFKLFRKKYGLEKEHRALNTASFQRPGDQLSLL